MEDIELEFLVKIKVADYFERSARATFSSNTEVESLRANIWESISPSIQQFAEAEKLSEDAYNGLVFKIDDGIQADFSEIKFGKLIATTWMRRKEIYENYYNRFDEKDPEKPNYLPDGVEQEFYYLKKNILSLRECCIEYAGRRDEVILKLIDTAWDAGQLEAIDNEAIMGAVKQEFTTVDDYFKSCSVLNQFIADFGKMKHFIEFVEDRESSINKIMLQQNVSNHLLDAVNDAYTRLLKADAKTLYKDDFSVKVKN